MNLLKEDLWRQLSGNIFYGVDVESKITPECSTPIRRLSKHVEESTSDVDKMELVLNDPRFGMLSLFRYHVTRGRGRSCKKHNTAFCSHLFSRWCASSSSSSRSGACTWLWSFIMHARTMVLGAPAMGTPSKSSTRRCVSFAL